MAWQLIAREGVTVGEAARRSDLSKRQLFRRLKMIRLAMATAPS